MAGAGGPAPPLCGAHRARLPALPSGADHLRRPGPVLRRGATRGGGDLEAAFGERAPLSRRRRPLRVPPLLDSLSAARRDHGAGDRAARVRGHVRLPGDLSVRGAVGGAAGSAGRDADRARARTRLGGRGVSPEPDPARIPLGAGRVRAHRDAAPRAVHERDRDLRREPLRRRGERLRLRRAPPARRRPPALARRGARRSPSSPSSRGRSRSRTSGSHRRARC